MFAYVKNGGVVMFMGRLPFNYGGVTGVPNLDADAQRALGFYPVIDETPAYDKATHRPAHVPASVRLGDTAVYISREIELKPPPDPLPAQEQARVDRTEMLKQAVEASPLVDAIKTSTPAQIIAYANSQVTDLPSARDYLGKLSVAIAYLFIKSTE